MWDKGEREKKKLEEPCCHYNYSNSGSGGGYGSEQQWAQCGVRQGGSLAWLVREGRGLRAVCSKKGEI